MSNYDAVKNTDTINFIVDNMDIFGDPARFEADMMTHKEMDYILRNNFTNKLHLLTEGQEMTGVTRIRWIDQWKAIHGIP